MSATMSYARCRSIGHRWDVIPEAFARGKSRSKWGYHIVLRCTECQTERRDVWTSRGTLSFRTYTYPEGYKTEYHPRDDWRADYLAELRRANATTEVAHIE